MSELKNKKEERRKAKKREKRRNKGSLLDVIAIDKLAEDPEGMAKQYIENSRPSKTFTNSRHRLVCFMAAFGAPQKDIVAATKFSLSHVQGLLTRGTIKKEIIRIQDKVIGGEAKKAFRMVFPEAFKTARSVMLDKKTHPSVRATQARDFMDRHAGKPLQRIENETTIISDLIMRLDESGKSKVEDESSGGDNEAIDVTPIPNTEVKCKPGPEPTLDVDAWMKENLGE